MLSSAFIESKENHIPKKTQRFNKYKHKQDARKAMRVVFFCTYKTYLYAQNKIYYEYNQILF